MNDLATVVLTSTRQHYGLTDIDKVTISDTLSKSNIIRESYKLCHIKVCPADKEIALDKKKWFESKGFEVIETVGDWSNDNESHGRGLIEDMAKIYSHQRLLNYDHVLQLENDWFIEANNLDNLISYSSVILHTNPILIYHRYSRQDQPNIVDRLDAIQVSKDLFITNREFSFNPFVSRTRDMKYISNFVSKNNIHPHCEKAYELAAKYLLDNDNIFSFTHNQIVRHVGWAENKEEYENKLKLLK